MTSPEKKPKLEDVSDSSSLSLTPENSKEKKEYKYKWSPIILSDSTSFPSPKINASRKLDFCNVKPKNLQKVFENTVEENKSSISIETSNRSGKFV